MMYLEQIPTLKSSIKLAKLHWVKLVHKFIFESDKGRPKIERLRKLFYISFKFEIDSFDFKTKLKKNIREI